MLSRNQSKLPLFFTILTLATLTCGTTTFGVEPSFHGWGALPTQIQHVITGSVDGSVVVGWTYANPDIEAFRWSNPGGIMGLGDLPGGRFFSEAYGVSSDGLVVVGKSDSAHGTEAFRWTLESGIVGLGDISGGLYRSVALAASADGAVVVGNGYNASGQEAFRWTADDGIKGLGDLSGGSFNSIAWGTSADGAVVVGYGSSTNSGPQSREAFRWTLETGMVGLGDLPGGKYHSRAEGASPDGTVVVGYGASDSGWEAFRWISDVGMIGLGDLPGGDFDSHAYGTSAEGSIVVGKGSVSSYEYEAFIWDEVDGMRNLQDVLVVNYGLDLTGWRLSAAWHVSADGLTISGIGNHNGNVETWIATIPEPATFSLILLGGIALAKRRKPAA